MNDMKLVKIQAVLERCAVSRATLYRMIEKGTFPCQKSLTGGRAVAWLESEVNEWIASRGTRGGC
ncbi:helix-turn-helix transcriptional regulator [Escherichia coli]|uniref:helix-turn-helix transcriptional regulator n=1 Tax=Escherichia coli TaxID=562 RepID=UPI000970F88B|nr:AlpA family transcriptional regulator [Escherichia coli]OMH05251.1 transcriptional regulator [Escherichia coli]